jgi:curved DNA-binding protein CbpA
MTIDYYKVLGVEPEADLTIIKRRYRQLVRQHHPDVAADPTAAHERIQVIYQAWTVLSDPAERARYDRSRQLGAIPPSDAPGASANNTQVGRSSPNGSASGGGMPNGRVRVDGWVGGNGTVPTAPGRAASMGGQRVAPGARPPRVARHAATARPAATARVAAAQRASNRRANSRQSRSRSANPRTRLLTMVFEAAELYFFHGRVQESIDICKRVIQSDPKNAEACALMGDIYAEQGRKDIAVLMYERAVRNQPGNTLYRQKWEALRRGIASPSSDAPATEASDVAGSAASPSPAPRPSAPLRATGSRPTAASVALQRNSSPSQYARVFTTSKSPAVALAYVTSKTQFATGLVLAVWGHLDPGRTNNYSDLLPLQLLGLNTAAAMVLGAALPLLNVVKRFGHVRYDAPAFASWPMLLCLALAGLIWFPLALLLYVIFSLKWHWWHNSLLRVIFAALMLSSAMTITMPEETVGQALQSALLFWSGRAIFPAMMAGWALGSLIRPR